MDTPHRFWTGMITSGDEPDQPEPPFKGVGWVADFVAQRRKPASIRNGKEIVLYADTWRSAQRALDLIYGCHQLLFGDPPVFPAQLIAHSDSEPTWMRSEQRESLTKQSVCTSAFPLACSVAAKASRKRRWVYAVAKYKFSLSLYFDTPHRSGTLESTLSRRLVVSRRSSDVVVRYHFVLFRRGRPKANASSVVQKSQSDQRQVEPRSEMGPGKTTEQDRSRS